MKTAAMPQRGASGPQASHETGRAGSGKRPFFSPDPARVAGGEAVQARLTLGRPGDRFEQEADHVADRVVDGGAARPGLAARVTPLAQRVAEEEAQAKGEQPEETQAKAEDEEPTQAREEKEPEKIQAKTEEALPQAKDEPLEEAQAKAADEEEKIQARPLRHAGLSVPGDIARQVAAARGRGNPLPGPAREKMEAQFGADFSGVRIHTDAMAVHLAGALRAQAFTRGNDIFFNAGKFTPGSRDGAHLLAHELTHTIQQGAVDPTTARHTDVLRLAPEPESYEVRPEILAAIRLARGEVGKVNAKLAGADGKRTGWERLRDYFRTAFGGPVVAEAVIDRLTMVERTKPDGGKERKDALPSWCGIFTWWAMKKAGIPIPDWKLGAPALDAMKLRPAGDMPRKGDIAIDVQPYNHFAMVTGLDAQEDAKGKLGKLSRVATINGNTAGADNLGGQVQERWDPITRWDHFFDPVGKMALPDVTLVTVSRAPTPEKEAEEAVPEVAPAAQPGVVPAPEPPEHRAELTDLATDPAPPVDLAASGFPEPDLSLPPPPPAGPAEVVATVAQVDLAGSSDAATAAFIDASPSAKAVSQPGFGGAVDAKMRGEQQELANNPPVLAVRTSGAADAPVTGADAIPIPAETRIGDGVTGTDPGALAPVAMAAPEPFRGNAAREQELEKEETGSFWDAFKKFLRGFVSGIRTKDGGIDTSAGARPAVALTGEADAGRMQTQREEGTAAMVAQRDAQTEAFRNNPGQANIQPRQLDETRQPALATEPAAVIAAEDDANVRDYATAPLPEDVRAIADGKIAARMAPQLAEARAQTTEAATARDTQSKTEIDTAQRDADQLNQATDAAQRKLVIDNRTKVSKLQGEGIGEAYAQVNTFNKEAVSEQLTQRKEIGDHVRAEEGKAKDRLVQGEADADKEKRDGEAKAAAKKAELEREQEKGSWWDRVKSAIKKAVKVITDAIDAVFTYVREKVKSIIEKAKNFAIGLINDARNWVVNKLNTFRDWAKDKVNTYLKDRFPALAKRINDGIDAVTDTAIKGVNAVADGAIKAVTALADGLAKALDTILSTFQVALKTAVRVVGAVMQGDFAEALRAAIEGACEIAGIDPKTVFDFLDRAGKAIGAILRDPVGFVKKLFGAVGDGIGMFFTNIKKHLIDGVIGWLTGALSEVNLSGPFEFTPKGILRIALEILGLTYANIKARVINKYPQAAKVFDVVETGFTLVKRLVTEGPGALWEEIKESAANIKETVMSGIRDWLTVTAIKEGIVWLLSLTNPASAIVKAVKLIFDLVMFLVERFQQIKDFVLSVYEAVSAVASGNFTLVVKAVEDALARLVPVLISLFASVLGLGNIAKQVKKIIETITRPINKAIDFVIDKIVAFAKKIIGKVKAGAKAVKEKVKAFLWPKQGFSVDGESHSIFFETKGGRHVPYIRSTPTTLEAFIAAWEKKTGPNISTVKQGHLANAKISAAKLKKLGTEVDTLENSGQPVPDAKLQEILAEETVIAGSLKLLLGTDDSIAKEKERYKLEGLTGTFGTIPKPTGDNLTGDHQPQAASIKLLAGKPYFAAPAGAKIRNRAAGTHADNAYVINLGKERHEEGRTFKSKGANTLKVFTSKIESMEQKEPTDAGRRKAAVDLLKAELTADVTAMRAIYHTDPTHNNWNDIKAKLPGDDTAQKALVTEIKTRVARGESVMSAQPMDELAS